MNKKLVITLVVVGVIIAGTLIANTIVGSRVAESVDQQLKSMQTDDSMMLPFEFEYESVSSNPIGGSVTIHNFKIASEELDNASFKAESVEMSMPLSEILSIMNEGKKLESIHKMSIALITAEISMDNQVMFKADEFALSYDGELSIFEIERAEQGILPSTRQSVGIRARGMRVTNVEEALKDLDVFSDYSDSFISQLKERQDLDLQVSFDPDKKTLTIDELSQKNGYSSMEGEGTILFTGEKVEDFEPVGGDLEISYDVNAYEMNNPMFGYISTDGGSMSLKADFKMPEGDFMELGTPSFNFEYKAKIDNFEMDLNQENLMSAAQAGIPLEDSKISIRTMEIDIEKQAGSLDLNTLKVNIKDFVNLDAYAHLEGIDEEDMIGSMASGIGVNISDAKIEISDMSESIQELFEGFEESMPKPFPRKGGKIIIELSGDVGNPTIKGVTD